MSTSRKPTKHSFMCNNGDTYTELRKQQDQWDLEVRVRRKALEEAEKKFAPIREALAFAENRRGNIDSRLETWTREFVMKGGKL